jgi:GNAT superfamily N-acetyltransferase
MRLDKQIRIREAEITDIEIVSLTHLMNELGYDTTKSEMKIRLSNIQRNNHYKTYVATANGEVVGMVGMTKNYSYEQNGIYVRILALVIANRFRQHGIGRQLIKASEDWAKQIDANRILLNCGNREDRKIAHQFYQKMGYHIKSSGFYKKL